MPEKCLPHHNTATTSLTAEVQSSCFSCNLSAYALATFQGIHRKVISLFYRRLTSHIFCPYRKMAATVFTRYIFLRPCCVLSFEKAKTQAIIDLK